MSEKGWWEDGGGPEVEGPFQEDEGSAGSPVAFVLRTLAVILIFYISVKTDL